MSDTPLPEVINKFFVGAHGEDIVFLRPVAGRLSHDEALLLAAWLVSMVGDDERWGRILAAVQGS